MTLTKSDFLEYCACDKSFWLKKKKPGAIDWPTPTEFDRMLMADGYAVESQTSVLVSTWQDAHSCSFQEIFETEDGLYARADLVRHVDDGLIDLWEIKASTSPKSSTGADHRIDAAFQTMVAEACGHRVRSVGIIHVNKDYERHGEIDPALLLTISDVTDEVRELLPSIKAEAQGALNLLRQESIDEAGCDCIWKSKGQHCAAFGYFNPNILPPSIYDLPRLSPKQRDIFVAEKRFSIDEIDESEVTKQQTPVLQALQQGKPVVHVNEINSFLDNLTFPLYFYDYETFGSAVPISEGVKPHEQIPVQVSLHALTESGELDHFELLTDSPGRHGEIVEFLKVHLGAVGSVVSWNASFEKACNTRLARLHPDAIEFLTDINERTVDLMDVFKGSYVDPNFKGSTSIKYVLPVLCPSLQYDQDSVHDGAGAMEAWDALTRADNDVERERLRMALLRYCELDTLAMVKIFMFIANLNKESTDS